MVRWLGLVFLALAILACDSSTAVAPTAIPANPSSDTPHPSASADLTASATASPSLSPMPSPTVILTAKAALNIRSGPGTGYQILDTMKAGTTAKIIGQNSGWWNIQRDELAGWVINDPSLVDIEGDASQVAQVDAPPTAAFVQAVKSPAPAQPTSASSNNPQPTPVPVKPQPTAAPVQASGGCPMAPRPRNCKTAVAAGLSAQQAAACGLDGDGDGVACYGN